MQKFLLLFLICPFLIFSQGIIAYEVTPSNQLWVFDQGERLQVDYLKTKDVQHGGNFISYTSSANYIMHYKDGKKTDMGPSVNSQVFVGDDVFAVKSYNNLNVIENGEKRRLTMACGYAAGSDSFLVFVDNINRDYNLYYKGRIIPMEANINLNPLRFQSIGDNILAYIDYNGYFNTYYKGRLTQLDYAPPVNFTCGKDLVAYTNITEEFRVLYKGENFSLENMRPREYKAGDEFVAYISSEGYFKVFCEGKTYTISTFAPDFYKIEDYMMVYSIQGRFYYFYKGQSQVLENFIPETYLLDQNSLFYKAYGDRWVAVQFGKKYQVANQHLFGYGLNRDLFMMKTGINDYKVYREGKVY